MNDLISRQAAIDDIETVNPSMLLDVKWVKNWIKTLPSAQPEPISEAYAKAVFTWLLNYQIKTAEMEGRYIPYEVLSWVANDWRKENEIN